MYHYDDITLHYLVAVKLHCKKEWRKKRQKSGMHDNKMFVWMKDLTREVNLDAGLGCGFEFLTVMANLFLVQRAPSTKTSFCGTLLGIFLRKMEYFDIIFSLWLLVISGFELGLKI